MKKDAHMTINHQEQINKILNDTQKTEEVKDKELSQLTDTQHMSGMSTSQQFSLDSFMSGKGYSDADIKAYQSKLYKALDETADAYNKNADEINAIIDFANASKETLIVKAHIKTLDELVQKLFDKTVNSIQKVSKIDSDEWETLIRPQKRVKIGTVVSFDDDFECVVTGVLNDGITHVKFNYKGIFLERLNKVGAMPLPPYIHEKLKDNDRYQTVYSKNLGSAAAPTAGLHFTNELLDKINEKGINILYVTLNIGLGTFRPVTENNITNHNMHSEKYEITEEVAKKLNEVKENGKRIICVGTTSLRTLESNYQKYNRFKSTCEETDIFIYPPYKFKSCDALITNFHLPKSTLIMLVSAFSSVDIIMNAYKHAIDNKYRFFSFGDAMFLTNKEVK